MNRRNAYLTMLDAHSGQNDKSGEPYIFHPIAVAEAVRGLGEDYEVVAFIHDVIEDTDFVIRGAGEVGPDEGLTPEQALALQAITKDAAETYKDYIRRVRHNFIASVVKVADLKHNLSPERQAGFDEGQVKGLTTRYRWALNLLENGEEN